MTIKLLHNVGDDQKGAVLDIAEDRARRLIRTGYAEAHTAKKKKEKEPATWQSKD